MFPANNLFLQNDKLRKYICNYHINLIDINKPTDINRFKTDLQQIFGMLQCRKNKERMKDYFHENKAYFQNIDINTCTAFAEMLHSQELKRHIITLANGKETVDMCQALDELYQDGVNFGISQGISLGLQKLIETIQEFGGSKDDAISKVAEKFNLPYSDAVQNVEKHWKTTS